MNKESIKFIFLSLFFPIITALFLIIIYILVIDSTSSIIKFIALIVSIHIIIASSTYMSIIKNRADEKLKVKITIANVIGLFIAWSLLK